MQTPTESCSKAVPPLRPELITFIKTDATAKVSQWTRGMRNSAIQSV